MSLFYNKDYNEPRWFMIILSVMIVLILFLFLAIPPINVWRKELRGKADLKEATWSRQIAVEEAKAKLESAKLFAEAEIERSKGVAQSNQIIADGLKNNDEYLRYLYIQSLNDLDTQLIYVPTEAGLPILEANR